MRLFIALYNGLPYDPEDTTAIPEPAWNILRKEGAASPEELSEYEDRVISIADLGVHPMKTGLQL